MFLSRRQMMVAILGIAAFAPCLSVPSSGEEQSATDAAPGSKAKPADISALRVSGPYVHKNLAVYLIHSKQRDDREFITLNEGLKSGEVKVTELNNEQVNRLEIENRSDKPLFLQEGDRVTGGKQDRTIYSSLVIAPKSKPQPIPTFCIEASRWTEGQSGKSFVANPNDGYASNSVRVASKLGMNQQRVWMEVAKNKRQLMDVIGTKNTNSSLNEAVDSKEVVQSTEEFDNALSKLIGKHQDAVGFAFAVNGKILEVDAFPGNQLASKVFPRMLETYAIDAVAAAKLDKDNSKAKAPSKDVVLNFMKSAAKSKVHRDEKVNPDNQLVILAAEPANTNEKQLTYQCQTKYDNRLVHLQWIKAEKQPTQAELQQMRLNNPRFNFNPSNYNPSNSPEQQQQLPNDAPNEQRRR